MKLFITRFSKKQLGDAGLAFILLALLLGYFSGNDLFYLLAIAATLTNMTFPVVFYPFAVVWYFLSGILGRVMSALILSLIFILLVIPVGIFRRITGKTKTYFPHFSKENRSIMFDRMHTFTPDDITRPY